MSKISLMQRVLESQWQQLPPALQAHYTVNSNQDIGELKIEYPSLMQSYLNCLYLLGALINKKGVDIKTIVEKKMVGDVQHWERNLKFINGDTAFFKSRWEYVAPNQLIEYVNPFMGLLMNVKVEQNKLYYEGICLKLRLGYLQIPIPEWLVLGHTTIIEEAIDETHFSMDFKLHHPLFGLLYRYSGGFVTEYHTNEDERK